MGGVILYRWHPVDGLVTIGAVRCRLSVQLLLLCTVTDVTDLISVHHKPLVTE